LLSRKPLEIYFGLIFGDFAKPLIMRHLGYPQGNMLILIGLPFTVL